MEGDKFRHHTRNLHRLADVNSLRHNDVRRHFVELNTREFRKERLDLIARDSIILQHSAQAFHLSFFDLAMVELTEFRLEEFAVRRVPLPDIRLLLQELLLIERERLLKSLSFLLNRCICENLFRIRD